MVLLLDIGFGVYENGMGYTIWYIVCLIRLLNHREVDLSNWIDFVFPWLVHVSIEHDTNPLPSSKAVLVKSIPNTKA